MMLIGQIFTIEVKRWKARWNLYPIDQVKPFHLSLGDIGSCKQKLISKCISIVS
jgi:hypothetical protein